jgi:hypothetical protein
MAINLDAVKANVKRYGTGSYEHDGALYEVAGSTRTGYSLWLMKRTPYGVRRDTMLMQFKSLHELSVPPEVL